MTSTGSRTTVNVRGNKKISDVSCSLCGQCITHCPVGALHERDDTEKVFRAIADPNKVVVHRLLLLYVPHGVKLSDYLVKRQL